MAPLSPSSRGIRLTRRFARGFTLVELMIVVAIIGVLAALAIYGVRRYLASAKTAEAKNAVGGIARSALAAYERESEASQIVVEGSSAAQANHDICKTGGAIPSLPVPASMAAVQGKKYQPDTSVGKDFETGDSLNGWRCLRFEISSPIYYQYDYTIAPKFTTGQAAFSGTGFEASAQGDLDGDATTFSQFSRTGQVNTATKRLVLASQVYINNEFD